MADGAQVDRRGPGEPVEDVGPGAPSSAAASVSSIAPSPVVEPAPVTRHRRPWSFRALLFAQGALLAAAPLLVVALVGWRVLVPQIRDEVQRGQESITQAAAMQIETHLASARRELISVATLAESDRLPAGTRDAARRSAAQAAADAESLTRMLDAVVGDGALYDAIYLAGRDGIVTSLGLPTSRRKSRPDILGADLSRREFVAEATQAGEMVWSSAFLSAVSGRLAVAMALPVKKGVLVGELALGQFSYFLRELPLGPTALAVVVDRRGNVVAHPRPELSGQQISLLDQKLIREGFAQGWSIGPLNYDGREMVGATRAIRDVSWTVLVAQPVATAYRMQDSATAVMLVGFGIAVLLALVLAFYLAARTARRLAAYAANAGELASGRYELDWPPTRVREFIRLGDDLQRMAAAIKSREDDLKNSEARYREVVHNSADLITRVDTQGRFTFVNRTAERIFGIKPEACLGRLAFDFVHPDDRASTQQAFERWLASKSDEMRFENRQVDGAGHVFSIAWSIHAHRNARGEVVEFSSIGHDLTEFRRAEEENRQLALVASSTSNSVLITDADGRVEWINAACEAATGFSLRDLRGQRPWDLRAGPATPVPTLAWMGAQMREGHGFRGVELAVADRQGRSGWVAIEVQPVRDAAGGLIQFVVIESDIQDRRAAQIALKASEEHLQQLNTTLEQRVDERTAALAAANAELRGTVKALQRAQDELIRAEKLAALGALVAGIAHELNTPIGNGLMAASTLDDHAREFSDALSEGPLKRSALDRFVQDVATATGILVRNMHKASELVTSFKQVAVDQTSAQRRRFGFEELVSEIILTMRPSFRKTPYQVDYKVPPDLSLDSYPGPLGQVLANLINNALLHGFDGRDHGTVDIQAEALGADRMRFSVSDDGRGISPENRSRIFDPFFTTKLGKGGSGLGLHIVHNIVTHILGGQISVVSDGTGTRFVIEIPLRAPDAGPH